MIAGAAMCGGEFAQDAADAEIMNAKPSAYLVHFGRELDRRGVDHDVS
jgi:hypothetical protein